MPTPRRAAVLNAMQRFSPEAPFKRGGDRDKGCRCGRTKCLKQYCACFRSDVRCTHDCVCTDCRNDGLHEDERMMAVRAIRLNSKEAFKGTDLTIDDQTVTTPKGSIKTVRGCRCKRSKCLKKYCECFGVGLKCGDNCICEGCKNGNEAGGGGPSSAAFKKKGPKGRASPSKPNSAPPPKTQHKAVVQQKHEVVPIMHTTQFKPQPIVASAGKMLAHRKPPLSVNIPAPASQPIPVVQRDLLDFSANTQEVSTAWGMTPLGSASIMPPGGVDRENSGFQSFPSFCSNTPTAGFIGVQRDMSGLPLFSAGGSQSVPLWQPPSVWNDVPSARSTLRSPYGMGFADSPKGISLVNPRSPLRSARSTVQGQATLLSPGAIFTAAEGMLPSPVRGQSGLSTLGMNEDLVHSMAREISARF